MSQGTNVQRFGIHFEWLGAGNARKVFTAVCNVFRWKSDKKVKRREGGEKPQGWKETRVNLCMTRRRGEVAKGPNECENELRENIIRSSMRGGF
jgi:hypothetical protein